jgi:hypothetical protein
MNNGLDNGTDGPLFGLVVCERGIRRGQTFHAPPEVGNCRVMGGRWLQPEEAVLASKGRTLDPSGTCLLRRIHGELSSVHSGAVLWKF